MQIDIHSEDEQAAKLNHAIALATKLAEDQDVEIISVSTHGNNHDQENLPSQLTFVSVSVCHQKLERLNEELIRLLKAERNHIPDDYLIIFKQEVPRTPALCEVMKYVEQQAA